MENEEIIERFEKRWMIYVTLGIIGGTLLGISIGSTMYQKDSLLYQPTIEYKCTPIYYKTKGE
jgi:hypothetical protein